MASLVQYELAWSNTIQEKITQFESECIRTSDAGIAFLSTMLNDILIELSNPRSNDLEEKERKDLLVLLFKTIGQTRDIHGGKGEYVISYMMIWTWYQYFPVMAELALALFVFPPSCVSISDNKRVVFTNLSSDDTVLPYGSWKDIKYFCDYVRIASGSMSHHLIKICIIYANHQLKCDVYTYHDAENSTATLSLVSKWIPREKSKFGWLHKHMACDYFPQYMSTVVHGDKVRAEKKCAAQYRMLYANLNRHLDTVQIKQTGKKWADIDHSKTTSITMVKQYNAFFNNNTMVRATAPDDPDRVQCAENLRNWFDSSKTEEPALYLVRPDENRYKPMEDGLRKFMA